MKGECKFFSANHLLSLREERCDGQKNWDDVNDTKIKELVADLLSADRRLILRTKNIGAWQNVKGNMVTGAVLAATEFCGFLCARYDVTPPPPPIFI